MKIGLIARADNRGLGIQTHAFYQNMPVDRTLVLVAGLDLTNGNRLSPFEQHPERYSQGDVMTVTWNTGESMPVDVVRDFLGGLDVVYSAETFYWDDEFLTLAQEMKVKTVLHLNPEFFSYQGRIAKAQQLVPDALWLPSSWYSGIIPGVVLPFPVDRTVIPFRPRTEAASFLHVIGHRTQADRNGTRTVFQAFRSAPKGTHLIVRSQGPFMQPQLGPNVNLDIRVGDIDNYADLYSEGDVFVMPRRFGGLCLPLNEALASGMAILMSDCPPQNTFLAPSMLVPARRSGIVRTALGAIPTYDCPPRLLAQKVKQLVDDPALVKQMSLEADLLADSISWETMRPRYLQELAQVIEK